MIFWAREKKRTGYTRIKGIDIQERDWWKKKKKKKSVSLNQTSYQHPADWPTLAEPREEKIMIEERKQEKHE